MGCYFSDEFGGDGGDGERHLWVVSLVGKVYEGFLTVVLN